MSPTKNSSSKSLPLQQLSTGYQSTLGMIADIAYRMAVLNPNLPDSVTLKTPGIMLVDEIDLHLHPCWQAKIIGDLTALFPSVQFIATTHAPAVISSIASKNLRILGPSQADEPTDQTYSRDAGSILATVMESREGPREAEEAFESFYSTLDEGSFDKAEKAPTRPYVTSN